MKKRNIQFMMVFLFGLFSLSMLAQQDITGVVTDDTGEVLPGVTILEKGTNNGETTDFDGKYTISVANDESTLVFSFVGMASQEVVVGSQSSINVVLIASSETLDEVVLTGYGSTKKSDLTGSVVRADLKTFENQANTQVEQMLQGNVAGVNITPSSSAGETNAIQIRGVTNLSGEGNSALIVVDGIIFREDLSYINPADIESIDILKDAGSAAIYGSQGANGVVVITTKKGRRGDSKPVFNYSGKYSIRDNPNRLTYHDDEGYLQLITDYEWPRSYPQGPDYDPNFSPLNGLNPPEFEGYEAGANVDWQDLINRTGSMQQHDLSVSGATDVVNYFVSTGFTSQEDILIGDDFERISGRINLEFKFTEWFKIGTNSSVSFNDYSGIEYSRGGYKYSAFSRPFNEDGSLVIHPNGQLGQNALIDRDNWDDDKRVHLNSLVYLVLDIPQVEGLSFRMNYGNSWRNSKNNRFSFNANDFRGEGFKGNNINYVWTLDNILSYNRTFGKHDFNVTAVYGREENVWEATDARSKNFANPVLGYNQMESGEIQTTSSAAQAWSSLYQLGRLVYTFNDKYNFKYTIRRDGYSGFGANNKTATFSTFGLGWTVSKEDFFEPLSNVVSRLKLRASYGESGNRGSVSPYSTLAAVGTGDDYVFGDGGSTSKGYSFERLGAPNLRWENTIGLDLGLEFGLFKNLIVGDITYYDTKSENQIYDVTIPAINGFETQKVNLGELSNKGIEISLTSRNIQTENFDWSTTFVFSQNNTKIVSLRGIDADGDGIEDDDIGSELFIGEDPFSVYNYNITGLYQIGDTMPGGYEPGYYIVEDISGDGTTDSNDKSIIGSRSPAYRWSMTNTLKYKNFTFSFFLNSIQGGKDGYLGRDDAAFDEYDDREKGKVQNNRPVAINYWTPDNPNAEYPTLRYDSPESGLGVYSDRSFVRLQDVNLSYSFDKDLIQKAGLRDLTLILGAKNLATWTDWKGVDPELGVDLRQGRPINRSLTLGLNVSF